MGLVILNVILQKCCLIERSSYAYTLFLYAHIPPRDEGADREAVDFEPGNQYILRYRPISSLVHTGAAKLV